MNKFLSLIAIFFLVLGCIPQHKNRTAKNAKPLKIEFFETYKTTDINMEWDAACDWVEQNDSLKSKNINLHSLIKVLGVFYQFGEVKKENVSIVESILKLPEVKSKFPKDLEFVWSLKSSLDVINNDVFILYAIKVPPSGEARVNGKHVKEATRGYDPQTNQNTINITMTETGTQLWAKMTTENTGRSIAITANRKVLSCPTVRIPITEGSTQISAEFTVREAQELADGINAGR